MCRNNPQLPQQFLSRINTPNLFSQLPQQNPQTGTRTPTLNLPQHSKTTQPSPSEEGSNSETQIPSSPSRDGSDSETSNEEYSSESQPSQFDEDVLQINLPQLNQTQFNLKWRVDEDKALLSAFMMSGVDQLKGTSETSREKWVNIMRDFELARQEDPYNIRHRKMEAIKSRWRRMNLSVKKWVDVYAEAKKQKGSTSSEADILAEAHRMYQGCSNGAQFTFEHSWDITKQHRNWQGSMKQ
ncbi:uncharacterized protein LOC110695847 [Chenopodium quinoa]|uniref:uncharacterized protein LOC110695847 n=1 Tax=Chenopodium quinoa TaxID=63459 RepID=UPI000B786363|nr:uncharacterized protein LOC110695847 [Chenopodium quinoa]